MDKGRLMKNAVVLGVALCFVLVMVLLVQFVGLSVENAKNRELLRTKEELTGEITSLSEEIEYKKSMQYVEKYAREQLGIYGEDDIIFVPKGK